MAVGSIGSGIDVASLVQQLVAAERAPADARLTRLDSKVKAEISSVGSLRSSLASLQTALSTAMGRDATTGRKASLPDGAGLTASATSAAVPGRYQVEVRALATAHKLSSAAFARTTDPVGTGRLTIASGDFSIDVDIDAPANSLASIRDAINAKAAGKGVSATIITADDGAHLVLTARDTGSSKAIRVTASGGDGALAAFAHDPPGASALSQVTPAGDALVRIDGMDRSSASNTITGAIDGITLTLSKAEPGTVRELRVDVDTSSQKSAVKALVSSFNAATQMVVTTSSYNTSTKTAAPLNGDAMARGIGADLRAVASANVADLKAVGITIAKDGTLKLDEAAFDASIAKDPAIAARLFTGASSTFAAALKGSVDGLLDGEGPLASRSEGLERRSKSLAKDRADLDMRMTLAESRYRTQFTALDSLMTKLNSSMSFLQQQLGL